MGRSPSRTRAIRLEGVRVHNLRGFDAEIPLGKLVVVTGVSGSGKSSLAFDTLYAEGQRRYLESLPTQARMQLPKFDRPAVDKVENIPPAIALGQDRTFRAGKSHVVSAAGILDYLRALFARGAAIQCPRCQNWVRPSTPETVYAELTRLPKGTEIIIGFVASIMPDEDAGEWTARMLKDGFIRACFGDDAENSGTFVRLDEANFDPNQVSNLRVVVDRLTVKPNDEGAAGRWFEALETAFARGAGRLEIRIGAKWHSRWRRPVCESCQAEFESATPPYFTVPASPECPYRFSGITWHELLSWSIEETAALLAPKAAEPGSLRALYEPVLGRLGFLVRVGLGYLSLDRPSSTLSIGEARRVALAAVLGTGLARTLFVLDEPTIGLHPDDTDRLVAVLRDLVNLGNTLVVVEHETQVIRAADHVIDLGPGAGREGGQIVYEGPPAGLADSEESVTGEYLAPEPVAIRAPRASRWSLEIRSARRHNLKDVSVSIPLDSLVVVAGVSGSGKSSLVVDSLYPALARKLKHAPRTEPLAPDEPEIFGSERIDEVVLIDDEPVGKSSRSNPATYLDLFGEIRDCFAQTLEAKTLGLSASDFSFNVDGGRCERCLGVGYLTIDMQFLPDMAMACPDCGGTRYQARVLGVKYRGLGIAEVLNLTAREAFRFFRGQTKAQERLRPLVDVGLDYLRLGQPLSTLSGGEAQRLKLASFLGPRQSRRCLFLFEEPTIGLHPADVQTLRACLMALLDVGHSVVAIEHDEQMLCWADHIIELGPGAGPRGGAVIATGSPRHFLALDTPTARILRDRLAAPEAE